MNKVSKKIIKNHKKLKQNQFDGGGLIDPIQGQAPIQPKTFVQSGIGQALGGVNAGGLASGIGQIAAGDTAGGIFNTVGSIAEGIPVFGGLIGGALKGIGGIFSMGAQRKKELKEFADKSAIKQQEAINAATNFNNSVGNKIYPDSLGSNIYAKGGQLETVNPNEDLIRIESGGTHEENPIGGVPVGTDVEGTMNTVEQGETILKDFVYSNRIKLPEDIDLKSEYNLPNALKGKTFAKASEIINNKFKEREDKVSLETKQAFLDRLASLQEELKQAEKDAEMIANGIDPNIENQAVLDTQNEQVIDSIGEQPIVQENEDMMPQNQFALGGLIGGLQYDDPRFKNASFLISDYRYPSGIGQKSSKPASSITVSRPRTTSITDVEKFGPSGLSEDILTIKTPDNITERNYNRYTRPSYMDKNGNIDWSKVSSSEARQLIGLSPKLRESYEEYSLDKKSRMLDTAAATNAIAGNLSKLSMNKAPSRADYSTPLLPQFGTLYPRLTNKARLFNAIDRSARSAEYSLRNLAGSNPGALMANLGSLRARQLNAKADTALQIEDRDNQIKMAIDQYNNQSAQRNALQNQQIIRDNQSRYMDARRDYEDTRASIIGGLFGNLGQIIQDRRNKNFIQRMAPIYGRYSMLAGISPNSVATTTTKRKYGGKIKRK
jgi:hypothetical protein|nr:MAG TPA: hypothetical protein [Crassvirales sp.]